jgi:hypothetical protein
LIGSNQAVTGSNKAGFQHALKAGCIATRRCAGHVFIEQILARRNDENNRSFFMQRMNVMHGQGKTLIRWKTSVDRGFAAFKRTAAHSGASLLGAGRGGELRVSLRRPADGGSVGAKGMLWIELSDSEL